MSLNKKKFKKFDNIEEYKNFTTAEAGLIVKNVLLNSKQKKLYYRGFIDEFGEGKNEYTKLIIDLIKYGKEKVDFELLDSAIENELMNALNEEELRLKEALADIEEKKEKITNKPKRK